MIIEYICTDNAEMARISIKVDKIANSIVNRLSGDGFDTDVVELQKSDLKSLVKGWEFDWRKEASVGNVYKLVIRKSPEVIQGLISLNDKGDHIFMNLIESAKHNIGKNKVYEGVAGNLIAFACQQSFDKGYDGIVVFEAKTKLIEHYRQTLSAQMITGHRMFINTRIAIYLIDKYFNR